MSGQPNRTITGDDDIIPISRARRKLGIPTATQGSLDSRDAIPSQTQSASEITPTPVGLIDEEVPTNSYRQSDAELAFSCISTAADTNNDKDDVDRTNGFDEWKDYLQAIARKIEGVSPEHRQILGMLMAATSNRELFEFDLQALFALRDVTSLLRKSRIIELDTKYALRIMKKSNLNVFSNIDYDFTEEKALEAEQILKKLLTME